MDKENGQSASKSLSIDDLFSIYEKGSTTIPQGSRLLETLKTETPGIEFYKLFGSTSIKDSCVYMILNINTMQFYIGSTKNIQNRLRKHRYRLTTDKRKHWNYKLRMMKEQKEFLYWGILKKTFDLEKVELMLLRKYKNNFEELILNLVEDTQRVFLSSKAKEKIRESNKKYMKKVYAYSVKGDFYKSFESVTSAAAYFGIQRGNIRKCIREDIVTIGGYVFRDFYKKKIKVRKSMNNADNARRAVEYSKKKVLHVESGKVFDSISDTERFFGFPRGVIGKTIKDNRKYKNKYTFKFYEDIV